MSVLYRTLAAVLAGALTVAVAMMLSTGVATAGGLLGGLGQGGVLSGANPITEVLKAGG